MQEPNGRKPTDSDQVAVKTAEQIVDDIITWTDPEKVQKNLEEMFYAYFLQTECSTEEDRQDIFMTFRILSDALMDMEQLNPRSAANAFTDQEKARIEADRAREKASRLSGGDLHTLKKNLRAMYALACHPKADPETKERLSRTWNALNAELEADIKYLESLRGDDQ